MANPDTWQYLALGDLVNVVSEQIDPNQSPATDYNYISLENIEAGTGKVINFAPTKGREIGSTKTVFHKGDVLYSRLRPYLQKVVVAQFGGIAVTELIPFKPKNMIDPEYLREYLLSPDHREDILRLMSGARMPRVRVEDLLDLKIPVPPIDDQIQIVRSLEIARYQTAQIHSKLNQTVQCIEDYGNRLLAAAFNGELSEQLNYKPDITAECANQLDVILANRRIDWEKFEAERQKSNTNARDNFSWKDRYPEPIAANSEQLPHIPSNWTWASVSQITSAIDPICYGVVETGDEVEDGVLLVRTQDIIDRQIDCKNMRQISKSVDAAYPRSQLKGGEVLVSLVGSIGRVSIVPNSLAGANINRALAKLTVTRDVQAEWLAYCLETPRLQEWMLGASRGVARNILNLSTLASAAVPIPPLQEAAWLINHISAKRDWLRVMRCRVVEAMTVTGQLWTSIQKQSFTGEFIIQNPDTQLLLTAQRARHESKKLSINAEKGKRKVVSRSKTKNSNSQYPKRNLAEVLKEHPNGLDPLRLLEEAGYSLQEVEAFFKALASAISNNKIMESRPNPNTSLLVGI